MRRWRWVLRLLGRRMWLRAAFFCLFAVLLALFGAVVAPYIPYEFGTKIGAKSVDHILDVLASSMLAVTTFSLTAMVQAYAGATNTITPRAVQLLVADTTSQNALSTFLGSFLFAIVGIIALSTGAYGETGRVILYVGTIFVLLVIVVTFLRWIAHIARFGRVSDTISRVERAACAAAATRRPLLMEDGPVPILDDDGPLVPAPRIGRVTHVALDDLGEIARGEGVTITVLAPAGTLVGPSIPLARIGGDADGATIGRIARQFSVEDDRAFDHDPRFGLVVLAEIASRAMPPAVNDPGTVIAAIEAGSRVLAALLADEGETKPVPKGVVLAPLLLGEVLRDLYRPIARDGAAAVEVGIHLQKSLAMLAALAPAGRLVFAAVAGDTLERSLDGLAAAADRDALRAVHEARFPPRGAGGVRA